MKTLLEQFRSDCNLLAVANRNSTTNYFFTVNRYTIAVLNEHVDPAFPYISDTGSYSPESCIFGQLVNIAAFISEYKSYDVVYTKIQESTYDDF